MKHSFEATAMKLSALLIMLFCCIAAGAQVKNAAGVVVDQKGAPLVGVNVIEKGTNNGTISDVDGKFQLSLTTANPVLAISCIGFSSQEIPAKASMTITLGEDTNLLEDVVVIGYVTARKKDLTGSVIQVRPDNYSSENLKTVQDILRGTAGLNIGYNASAKGGGDIQVRGQRSVYTDNSHNSPLLILDGMMFYGELSEINPDDIEQIDVLKDASSAALYGAKGANGVIVITTKKGKMGKPVVNLTANVGFSEKADYWGRWKTPEEYLKHYVDWKEVNTYGMTADGTYEPYQTGYTTTPAYFTNPNNLPSDVSINQWRGYTTNQAGESDMSIWARRLGMDGNVLENFLAGKWVDWEAISFRKGLQQDYNASISGATDKVNYYLSLGYLNNEGVLIDDSYKAFRANMKINAKVTDWFEVGANVNFQDRSDGSVDLSEDEQMRNSPYGDYKDEDGNLVQYPMSSLSQKGYNYEFQKQYLKLEKGYTVLNSILNAKVKLPFNIVYSFNFAPRYQFFYDRYFMSADLPGSVATDRGVNREQAKRVYMSCTAGHMILYIMRAIPQMTIHFLLPRM